MSRWLLRDAFLVQKKITVLTGLAPIEQVTQRIIYNVIGPYQT